MRALALAGCAAEVYTLNYELRLESPDVKVLGALNVPSPLLSGTVMCPTIHCEGFDCPSDAQALACYHQSVDGDAFLDGGCLHLGGQGDVLWSFTPQACAASDAGYQPVYDDVLFRVLGTGRVHAEATDIEDLVELFLDPGSQDAWPADWRAPAGQPLRIVEDEPFRLYPLIVENLTGLEVGWRLDDGEASTTGGIDARWNPELLAIDLTLAPDEDGEVLFRVGDSPAWPIREVTAVPHDAPASMQVVVGYYRDPLTAKITPVGARAIVRDAEGRLVWGTPVRWTLDKGELAVGDPWIVLPGQDYVSLLDECLPPEELEGPQRATIRATYGDLTATADLAWNNPPFAPDPDWERNPYCVVGAPPAEDPTDPTTPPVDPPATTTPPPEELQPDEFIAGAGGCRCSTGGLPPVFAPLLALVALRRRRR
jgi:hypothetical protein